MRETSVQSLGWEDPLEKAMATHSSILAWENPMDRGAWRTVHGVTKSQTRLSDNTTWLGKWRIYYCDSVLHLRSKSRKYCQALWGLKTGRGMSGNQDSWSWMYSALWSRRTMNSRFLVCFTPIFFSFYRPAFPAYQLPFCSPGFTRPQCPLSVPGDQGRVIETPRRSVVCSQEMGRQANMTISAGS